MMIKYIIQNILRVAFLPITLFFLLTVAAMTAVFTFLGDEDWEFWKRYNGMFLDAYPFYKDYEG